MGCAAAGWTRGMKAFFKSHGTGDLGSDTDLAQRRGSEPLETLHTRNYVSIFGKFELERTSTAHGKGRHLDFVPLDNRLQFPESDFSYLLQDWDQELAVEQPLPR